MSRFKAAFNSFVVGQGFRNAELDDYEVTRVDGLLVVRFIEPIPDSDSGLTAGGGLCNRIDYCLCLKATLGSEAFPQAVVVQWTTDDSRTRLLRAGRCAVGTSAPDSAISRCEAPALLTGGGRARPPTAVSSAGVSHCEGVVLCPQYFLL